jgi:transcriptional regulator with XRE-family HTH domain
MTVEFTDWLRAELEKRAWDQSELARRMQSHPGTVGNVLNGNRQAGPDFCIAVARALGMPREEVFRARGWLLRNPQDSLAPDADPRVNAMWQTVNQMPPLQREAMIEAWGATLRAAGFDYEPFLEKTPSTD